MTTSKQRTAIRRICGYPTHTHIPVHVVYGSLMPPKLVGEWGGWYTKGGSYIHYPGAYSKKGWSNMEYICSSKRIFVGERWIKHTDLGV